jgi:hypothetical protein
MCCHQYPTRVVSSWDDVASSPPDGSVIVRSRYDCQHQGGRELEWCGRVNESESLINAVSNDQPKVLRGWGQQARGQARVLLTHPTQTVHHRRRGGTYPTRVFTGNVVSRYLSLRDLQGKHPVREAEGDVGKGEWRKRRPLSNRADRDYAKRGAPPRATLSRAQARRLPLGLWARERLGRA